MAIHVKPHGPAAAAHVKCSRRSAICDLGIRRHHQVRAEHHSVYGIFTRINECANSIDAVALEDDALVEPAPDRLILRCRRMRIERSAILYVNAAADGLARQPAERPVGGERVGTRLNGNVAQIGTDVGRADESALALLDEVRHQVVREIRAIVREVEGVGGIGVHGDGQRPVRLRIGIFDSVRRR